MALLKTYVSSGRIGTAYLLIASSVPLRTTAVNSLAFNEYLSYFTPQEIESLRAYCNDQRKQWIATHLVQEEANMLRNIFDALDNS